MRKAFTLIELMMVMFIIGISVFSVSLIAGERAYKGDELVSFFEELFKEHLDVALEYGVPIEIIGFKGSANIVKHDGTRIAIPGVKSVQAVKINDENSHSIEYYVKIYPDGICDHFIIETDSGNIIESYPLLMTVARRKI